MSKSTISSAKLKPSEIVIHFDDPEATSKKIISQAKELGIDLGMTAKELDVLRARGPELRRWLSAGFSRREVFASDPQRALAEFGGEPRRRERTRRPTPDVRWQGLTGAASVETAGAMVGDWALRGPGRLTLLMKDPQAAIEAALVGEPKQLRTQLLEKVRSPIKIKSVKKPKQRRA